MSIIFFDTETTGNGDNDRLCQLAIKERGKAEPVINNLYKPPIPISIESMAIHHITEKMVAGKDSFQTAPEYTELKKLFENKETISVAHNVAFDVAMLEREKIIPARTICTYKVAYALDSEDNLSNYRLQYLRYLLKIEIDASAHDALGDVLVLEALFERLLTKMMHKNNVNEKDALNIMLKISARPLLFTTIRFGKHKDERLEDIARSDSGYLKWLLEQKKKDPTSETDWIYSLEHYLAKVR
ncbi:MAG TPA: hypothetical protein ENJ75_00480 [Candidatus Kaiserbacteria bacterium]|nr:hypothetical protein [Candidatus Kaiserbacteria bacterium]